MKAVINNFYEIDNLTTVFERDGKSMGKEDDDLYLTLIFKEPDVSFNKIRSYVKSGITSIKVVQDNGHTTIFDTYTNLVSIDHVINTETDEINIIIK